MSVNGGLGKYYSLAYLKVKITLSKIFQGEDFLAGGSTYLLEEEGGYSFNYSLPLSPTSQALRH